MLPPETSSQNFARARTLSTTYTEEERLALMLAGLRDHNEGLLLTISRRMQRLGLTGKGPAAIVPAPTPEPTPEAMEPESSSTPSE